MKTYKKSQSGTACFEQQEKSGAGSLANGSETGAFVRLRGSREPLVYLSSVMRACKRSMWVITTALRKSP